MHKIPGKVEAEHYDEASRGCLSGYRRGQSGADYREATQVDIEKRSDASNGHGIVNCKGEWLHYTVEVETGGTYTLETPVASQKKGGDLFSRWKASPSASPYRCRTPVGGLSSRKSSARVFV